MINYFNFAEFGDDYLLTNDCGGYVFLTKNEMKSFLQDQLPVESPVYQCLIENYFIYDGMKELFAEDASKSVQSMKNYLFTATSLHIFVVTKNCNHHCVYCQASVESPQVHYSMSIETARQAVDIALGSPNPYLSFEFQGGEPLFNFDVIRFILQYAEDKKGNKTITYSLVSNLTMLSSEMLEILQRYNVNISTSLDGHEELHNVNRPMIHGNSYQELVKKISLLKELGVHVSAIQTTTRYSLQHAKQIVDQYVSLGLDVVFVRPLTPLGFAMESWERIGYTSDEFIAFYKEVLLYIIDLAKAGVPIREGLSRYFLTKMLQHRSENYMELRSPCGGALGQLAYYFNGKIYTCDEARMLSEMGNDSFLLGDVRTSTYSDLVQSPVCKTMCVASCLESLPGCCDCVFSPYCGVCPVVSLAQYRTLFPHRMTEYHCKIHKGIISTLFELIKSEDNSILEIFKSWI